MSEDVVEWVNLLEVRRQLVASSYTISSVLSDYVSRGIIKVRLRHAHIVHGVKASDEENYVLDRAADLRIDKQGTGNVEFSVSNNRLSLRTGDIYPLKDRTVSGVGIFFDRDGLIDAFGEQILTSPEEVTASATKAVPPSTPAKNSAGAKASAKRWSEYAAALAVIVNETAISADDSENSIHERVAQFLSDRGRQPYDVDTVRTTIRMMKAWVNGNAFEGDRDD